MFDFADRVVIVTGAAGSLGTAVARAFETAGARLALVDHSADRLRQGFADLKADCLLRPTGLTQPEDVSAMVSDVMARFGRIDVLANIAGGFTMGTRVQETPIETWDFMLSLNARTVFLVSRAVIRTCSPRATERSSTWRRAQPWKARPRWRLMWSPRAR